MSAELTNKFVKCRVKHRCDWCGEWINPGERANYRTGVYEGNFYTAYQHTECHHAYVISDFGHDNEYAPMEQERGIPVCMS